MKVPLAFLAFLLVSACQQAPVTKAAYRPEEAGTVDHALCLLGFTAVPLRKVLTGHQLVEARVNGRKATFVLDTGANVSVVHAPAAAALGLPTTGNGAAGAIGLGGAMKAQQARLDRLEIAGIPIRQTKIMTSDLTQIVRLLGPMSGGSIAGIIGQDVMQEHRAVIDVARSILYLMAKDEAPAPVDAAACRDAPKPTGKSAQPAKAG